MQKKDVSKDFKKGDGAAERREERMREFKSRESADEKIPLGKNAGSRTVKRKNMRGKTAEFEKAYQNSKR